MARKKKNSKTPSTTNMVIIIIAVLALIFWMFGQPIADAVGVSSFEITYRMEQTALGIALFALAFLAFSLFSPLWGAILGLALIAGGLYVLSRAWSSKLNLGGGGGQG